jgi:hypothetical protein
MSNTVRINLSQKSIQSGIKKIERYKETLNRRCLKLVELLTERGAKIAKINVRNLGAFYTGELEASIDGYFSPSLGVGIVYAGAWYAVYVALGSGIRGQEAQHPLSGEVGWVYDVNGHGEEGWTYFNERDGQFHWTDGMPSRPFMHDMVVELDRVCESVAKAVFR